VYRPGFTIVGIGGLLVAGSQGRSGLVSAAGLLAVVLGAWSGRRRIIGVLLSGLVLLIAVGVATGLRVELGSRELSVEQLLMNVSSIVEPDEGTQLADTVEWRLSYWNQVVEDSLSPEYAITGMGYGPILADRYGFQGPSAQHGQPLRSVHNSHLTILARGGVAAFVLWGLLWGAWFVEQGRSSRWWRGTRNVPELGGTLLLCSSAVALLVNAVFDPTLEGPQVGIWLWVLFGLGVALSRTGLYPERPRA